MKRLLVVWLGLIVTACASSQGTEVTKLDHFTTIEKAALAQLSKESPQAYKELEEAIGYAIIEQKVLKVPIVGAGGGSGVVVEKATGKRSYLRVYRLDLGMGWGAKSFKLVIIFQDEKALQNLANGQFSVGAGAEAAAKAGNVGGGRKGVLVI